MRWFAHSMIHMILRHRGQDSLPMPNCSNSFELATHFASCSCCSLCIPSSWEIRCEQISFMLAPCSWSMVSIAKQISLMKCQGFWVRKLIWLKRSEWVRSLVVWFKLWGDDGVRFELKSYSSGFLSNSVICGFCGKQSSFAMFQPWSGLVPAVPAFVQRVQTHLFPHVSLQNLCLISLIVSMPR